MNLSQPPTYAPLVILDQNSQQQSINPVWLEWFLQYGQSSNQSNAYLTGSYNDVTSSRVANQFYQNTTGRIIFVSVGGNINPSSTLTSAISLVATPLLRSRALKQVASITNPSTSASYQATIFGAVPAGWYYEILLDGTIQSWLEL